MAYNPFDDIIEQDPAYMADGGTRAGIIKPVTTDQGPRYISQAIADFYGMLTPEEELKQQYTAKEESQQKLLQESQPMIQAIQAMQPNSREQLLAIKNLEQDLYNRGYQNFNIQEILGMTGQFLYGDQRKAFDKLAAAEPLTSEDRMAIAFAPLDLLDFLFPPVSIAALKKVGLNTVDDVLKSTAKLPEVEKIKQMFGGSGLPQKPPGMETSQVMMDVADRPGIGTGQAFKEGIPYDVFLKGTIKNDSEDFVKLAEILNKTPIDELDKTITQIARENNLNTLFKIEKRKDKKDKKIVKQYVSPALARYNLVPEEKLNKLKNISSSQSYKTIQPEIINSLQKFKEEGKVFETAVDIAAELGLTKGSFENMTYRNPEIKKLKDSIVLTTPKGTLTLTTQDKFFRDTANIFANKQKFVDLYKDMQNSGGVKIIDEINALKRQANVGNEVTTFRLFQNYMYDKFRSIKGTKGNEGLSASKFVDKYMDDSDLDNFKKYAELELERNKANVLSRTALEELYQLNPQYRPYLLNDKGKLDITLLQYDKAHDIPMFVTRKEGKGRLQTKGRFVGAGSEVELIQPNLQTYNNLQRRVDPNLNFFADVLNNKTLEKKFKEIPAKITKNRQPTLENPITQRLINTLAEYGYKPDVSKFDNQFEFIKEVTQFIDTAYKDRKIRSIVPIRTKGSLKDNAIFGIEEPQLLDPMQKVQSNVERLKEILDYNIANNISPKDSKSGGYLKGFKKGGPVHMALGGDPLQNLNQQQYSPDPAFDEDYFQQAVESGNLQAANLLNLFKVFKKPLSVATPENIKKLKEANEALAMPTPGAQQIAPLQAGEQDFFFKSYLLDQLADKNAPQAATPEAWKQYLIKGKKVPEAEITDTGILQYLEDTEKFYPGKKITKEDIQALYDTSPLGNIEVRVKDSQKRFREENVLDDDATITTDIQSKLDFKQNQGPAKHQEAGSAKIDEGAEDYFEVVVNVPTLPGQEKAYIQSGHYPEPNVLGFTRVGTYKNNSGETVAVIQEMQTDMLTEVRKEQERLYAMVKHLKKRRQSHVDSIERERARGYDTSFYENNLRQFDTKYPPEKLKALEETTLIEPYPNIAAKDLVPEKTKSLNAIQNQIEELMMTNVEQYTDPAYKTKVYDLAQEQNIIFEELANMNRSANYKEMLKGFEVPSTKETEALRDIANRDYPPSDVRPVVTFPPIPFNKQADYVDLLLKSTIQAAKQKGINKIAIMPADIGANPRWGKTTLKASREDKSSGDKFRNLYDKVGVQQLKNIAKKYDGKVEIEKIVDPTKSEKGLSFYQRDVDGNYFLSKEDVLSGNLSFGEEKMFIDQQLARAAHDMGADNVVYTREVAPGQTMDYWVNPTGPSQGIPRQDLSFELVPVGPNEDINAALVKIEETNPQLVDMYTITFDPSQFEGPMYMFKKKSGGIIDKDRLISITDIYGEYGR